LSGPDRRTLTTGLAATLGLAACTPVSRQTPILVNLADTPPTPPVDGANLATGEDSYDRLTVPVHINGQGPFDFVVDTGANRTVISEELAAQLGLPGAGMADIHGIAGVEPHPTSVIDVLDADQVRSRAIRAPTLPRERLGADGLLGVDVLRGRLVTLDFRRRRLRIGPAPREDVMRTPFDIREDSVGRYDSSLGTPIIVPAQYHFGQLIIVDSDVRGRTVKAFLDSGAQSTVANLMLSRMVLANPDPHAPAPVRLMTPVLSATGQTAQGEVGELPALRMGGLTIAGLRVVYADLHVFALWRLATTPAILIGVDLMRRFAALQLDYAGRRVLFYPQGVLPTDPSVR
jgi:predicted aspartyl protease